MRQFLLWILPAALASAAFAEGLQDAWLLSPRWNALATEHSPLSYPPVLTKTDFITFRASLSSTTGEFYAHEFGVTMPIALHQSAGITWVLHAFNTVFPAATVRDNLDDRANLGLITYAVNPWRGLHLGLDVTVAHTDYTHEKPHLGFGTDFGVGYDILKHPGLGNHHAGICMQNAVAPDLGARENLLRVLKLSLLSNYYEEWFESSLDLALLNPFGLNDGEAGRLSDERWRLNARLSFRAPQGLHLHGLVGVNSSGAQHIGAAGGFDIPTFVNEKKRDALSLAYQICWLVESERGAMSIYFRTQAGKHRLTADILLEQAFALYAGENFRDALLTFGRVIAEYPNYAKNDVASYHMARCELELLMYGVARARFEKLKEQYGTTALRAAADLDLMDISYRLDERESTQRQYEILDAAGTPDSLRGRAHYLMGQTRMKQERFAEAIALLDKIPRYHPDYVFGRHSIAVAYISAGQTDSAVLALTSCISYNPATYTQQEIINRSRVLLGYLYYESAQQTNGALARATRVLRKVWQDSHYFDDALLGLAWTSFKAAQWNDCMRAADALARSAKASVKAEGLLLKAYVFYAQNLYEKAVPVLEHADMVLANALPRAGVVRDSIARRHEQLRGDYERVCAEIEQLAMSSRPPRIRRRIAIVAEKQKRLETAMRSSLRQLDNAVEDRRREAGRAKLREDIQYALASATYLMHEKAGTSPPATRRKMQSIDRKIQKYEKKMDEIESE